MCRRRTVNSTESSQSPVQCSVFSVHVVFVFNGCDFVAIRLNPKKFLSSLTLHEITVPLLLYSICTAVIKYHETVHATRITLLLARTLRRRQITISTVRCKRFFGIFFYTYTFMFPVQVNKRKLEIESINLEHLLRTTQTLMHFIHGFLWIHKKRTKLFLE